jgi:hypothetical protein
MRCCDSDRRFSEGECGHRQRTTAIKKNDHAGGRPTAGDDPDSSTAIRKFFKVLCNPQLAVALLNAQLKIRAKARLPWSVRLYGRIYFRAGGDVEFGGVTLVGTVVPIEIVSHEGSHISIPAGGIQTLTSSSESDRPPSFPSGSLYSWLVPILMRPCFKNPRTYFRSMNL